MSYKSDEINDITKKCGEIRISIKKNAKKVYSFNCWFCDSIYLQMKKFTLHLEQEHETQLKQTAPAVSDKVEIEKEEAIDHLLIEDIKIENCQNEIGFEIDEKISPIITKNKLSPNNHQDPLENLKQNEISSTASQNNDITPSLNAVEDVVLKNEPEVLEDEVDNILNDNIDDSSELSAEDDNIDSDYRMEDSADEQLTETLKNSNKAMTKQYILELINAYHQKPILWNTSVEKCGPKRRNAILQNITYDLNRKMNTNFELNSVKIKLNTIFKQYEENIKWQMKHDDDDNVKQKPKLWFFENLSFLKPLIEEKYKQKRKKTYHKVKPLDDEVLSQLIVIYKNYDSIWNTNNIAFHIKEKRYEAIDTMLGDVKEKLNISLDADELEKHLLYIHNAISKDKQLKFECEAKQKKFKPTCFFYKNSDFLEEHQGPFKCPYCAEIILDYKDFQKHKSEHDGSLPFKCAKCGKGFKSCANLGLHIKRHLGILKFRCQFCGKGYPVNNELAFHLRSHTGAQPYLCSICGESFRAANSYDNHMRRHEQRFRLYCEICNRGFNVLTTYNNHVKAHLNVRDIICKICGKAFSSNKYLLYHKRIHEGKNYKCDICGKSFSQTAGLRQHKKQHGIPISSKTERI